MLEFGRHSSDSTDTDSCPQPFLVISQLLRARKALERIFASRDTEKIAFLQGCYGPLTFKCNVVGCLHYDIGFERLQERDNHVGSHHRSFKCPEFGCFYREVGFANDRSLNQHISRCHTDPACNKFVFPKLRSHPTEDEWKKFRDAIDSNDLDLVRDLVYKNSSFQDQEIPGNYTALQYAAVSGKVQIAQFLLQSGSNIGAVNSSGSALSVACFWGQKDMVQFLLSNSRCEEDVNSRNSYGETPLMLSNSVLKSVTVNTQLAVLRLLLDDSKVLPNSTDRNGRTLLSLVAGRGDSKKVQVVNMLLWNDRIDVDAKDNRGMTPLSWAANWGIAEVVKMFLQCDRGVDFNAKDASGKTPLSSAAGRRGGTSGNAASVVKMLLDHHGIDADAKDNGGRTPLSWAAGEGMGAVVEVFLERHREVDVNAMDSDGRTPLSWAAARTKDLVMTPAAAPLVVKTLLKHDGIDVDARDKGGRTPLSWAASSGMARVVEVFLQCDKEVDVNAEDNGGRTPLSWAAARENDSEKAQVVQALIKHGGVSGGL